MSTPPRRRAFTLSDPEVALLAAAAPEIRKIWTRAGLPVPALAETLLADAVGSAAVTAVAAVRPSGVAGSGQVPIMAAAGSDARCSSWPRTREAARQLGLSDRGIRKAITEGRLRAVRDREGAYRIDPEDLATYEPRSARDRRAADSTAA